jgi:molybdate transport system regulatory protein
MFTVFRMSRLTIRIDFANGGALGPGKVRLLELVAETGSIRKAAARMKMSYRQAWLLLKALEETFGRPLVLTATGGREGGGARLSPLGARVAGRYRQLELNAAKSSKTSLASLEREMPSRTAQTSHRPRSIRKARR